MKYYVYYRPDGVVQFSNTLQDGVTPIPPEGLTVLEVPEEVPPGEHKVQGGKLIKVTLPSRPEVKIAETRHLIKQALAETDWMSLRALEEPGKPISPAWKAYRKALRDMDPENPVWPVRPSS